MKTNTELIRAALLGAAASLELAADRAFNLGMTDEATIAAINAERDRVLTLAESNFEEM